MADLVASIGLDTSAAKKGLDSFAKQIDDVVDSIDGIGDAFDDVAKSQKKTNDATKKTARSVDDVKRAMTDLVKSGKQGTAEFADLRNELRASTKAAKDAADAMSEIEEIAKSIADEMSEPPSFFEKIKSGAESAGGGVGGLLGSFAGFGGAMIAVEALGAAFTAVSDAIGTVIEKGTELNKANTALAAKTGATGETLAGLEKAARDAFVGGVGESITDATNAIATAQSRLGDVFSPDEIAAFTKQASALGKTFDLDVSEVILKAAPFVKQFGLEGQEAFDLLAVSIRDGGTAANDVVDTLSEYSQQAKEAGLSAGQFADVLTRGAKEGIFNTDKLGDAIKETGIRLRAGDISSALGEIQGPISATIKGIVDAGRAGTKSVAEVLQESNAVIETAFASGEISATVRQQLQTGISGTPAEEIGSELYGRIFSAPLDETTIAARAKQAGELVSKNTGQATSFDSILREFDVFVAEIGSGLVALFDATIAPVIGVLRDAFGRISEAFSGAFSGDGASGIGSFLETLRDAFVGFIEFAIEPSIAAWELLAGVLGAVFDAIVDTVSPLTEVFSELFASTGEGIDILGTFRSVIGTVVDVLVALVRTGLTIVLAPAKAFYNVIAFLVRGAVDLVKWIDGLREAFVGWLTSFEPVRVAIDSIVAGLSSLGNVAGAAIDAVAGFLGLGDDDENAAANAAAETAKKVKTAGDEAAAAAAKTKKIADAARLAATETGALAKAFDEARAAADASVGSLTSAIAQAQTELEKSLKGTGTLSVEEARANLKRLEDEQVAARKRQRELARRADNADDVGNVERQKARKATREQQNLDDEKADRLRAANAIANARERERAVLAVEQEFALRSVDLQISTAAVATREDRVALENLKKQRATIVEENANAVRLLDAKFAAEDLQKLIDAEAKKTAAVVDAENARLAEIERIQTTRGTNAALIEEQGRIRRTQLERQAQLDARAYIENLAEFQAESAIIRAKVEVGDVDAETAKREIDDLYSRIDEGLRDTARAGGDIVSDAYRRIFATLGTNIGSLNREIDSALERFAVNSDQNLVRREFRRTLLEARDAYRARLIEANGNLAAERAAVIDWFRKRQQIETEYLAASSDAYAAAAAFRIEIEKSFAAAFSDANDAALAEQEDKYRTFIENLREQLRTGQIGWAEYAAAAQEAIDDIGDESTLSRIAEAFVSAINATAATSLDRLEQQRRESADKAFALYQSNNERIADLDRESTEAAIEEIRLRANGQVDEADAALQRWNDLQAEQTALVRDNNDVLTGAFESIGVASASAFGEMLVSGENAFRALVTVALDALQALVPILVAQIFGVQVASPNPANALSFGSAGTIAAAALTAVLQGLVSAAKAALKFADGVVDLPLGGHRPGVDTVPAWLTAGESVVTVEGTRARGRYLTNAEILRRVNSTGSSIESIVLDNVLRDRMRRGLALDAYGIRFADDLIERGATSAAVIISTSGLEQRLAEVSEELRELRKRIRTNVDLTVTAKVDKDRMLRELELSERERVRHLG